MTASVSLNQSVRVQQLLSELSYRTCQIGEQIQALEKLIVPQLGKLTHQREKERKQSKKFMPLYDREKFYQITQHYLSKFNQTLLKLFLETRLFEEVLQNYQATIQYVESEVANA